MLITVPKTVLQNGRLQIFEEYRLLRARVSGASVTKTATLLAVSRAAVSRGKTQYANDVKPSSAKRGDRKPKQSERDRHALKRIVCKSHKTTAAKVTPGLFVFKTMFPQKL